MSEIELTKREKNLIRHGLIAGFVLGFLLGLSTGFAILNTINFVRSVLK